MRTFASLMDLSQSFLTIDLTVPKPHLRFPNCWLFPEWGCQPHAQPLNLEDQISIFISHGDWVAQLHPHCCYIILANSSGYLCTRRKYWIKYITVGAEIAQWNSGGLRPGWSGVWDPAGAGNFSLHHLVQTDSGTHPASYPMFTRGSFPGGKAADHSAPPIAEVKNAWSYTCTPPIHLHGVVIC
jgi:hypothetical protein